MILLFFLMLPGAAYSNSKELTAAILKFIYSNEPVCGDQFANPLWLPAYDECTLKCQLSKTICLLNIQNKEQMCQPLPRGCVEAMRREFEWFEPETEENTGDTNVDRFEADMLQREEDLTTTTSSTSFITNAPMVKVENDVEDIGPYSFPNEEPAVAATTTVTPRQRAYADQEETRSTASAYEYPIQQETYQIAQTERRTTTTPTTTTTEEYVNEGGSEQISAYEQQEEVTTETAIRVIPGIRINRTQISISTSSASYQTEGNPLTEEPYTTLEDFTSATSAGGSRIDLVPPPPPPDAMNTEDERALTGLIHNFKQEDDYVPPKKAEILEKKIDRSRRCCEWALNGLCDGHWQKVRKICPKSCGVLVCEDIEGVVSCNRYPEIDVEECYHSMRKLRYSGVRTVRGNSLPAAAAPKTTSKRKTKMLRKKRRSKIA